MFENVDGRTTDGWTRDAGVTGILIAHLGAFGSGELKTQRSYILLSLFNIERLKFWWKVSLSPEFRNYPKNILQ